MRLKIAARTAVVFVTAALSGCSKGGAGVRLPSAPPGVSVWSLSTAPDVLINGDQLGADSAYSAGVNAAAFIGDARAVVAVGRSPRTPSFSEDEVIKRVMFFDLSGKTVADVGGKGNEPGEFASIGRVFEVDGGVAVWDRRNRKVAFFSRDGARERETSVRPEGSYDVVGVFDDGSIVTAPGFTLVKKGSPRAYQVWSSAGELIRDIQGQVEPWDGQVHPRLTSDEGGSVGLSTRLDNGCMARIREVVTGNELLAVNGGTGEVLALQGDRFTRAVFKGESRTLVTDEMLANATADMTARLPTLNRPPLFTNPKFVPESLDSLIAQLGQPGEKLQSVWIDAIRDEGQLWLREATCYANGPLPLGTRPRKDVNWQVIDVERGRVVAHVVVPGNIEILAIRSGKVLARVTDALGVLRVGLFSVVR